jgi:magnesium chelatase subunit D
VSAAWIDGVRAACLFATDPAGLGGVCVRAHAGPVRDAWLTLLRGLLPDAAPFRRVPVHVTEGRLLGGLDLAATLGQGRPVAECGLLAEADGGVLLLSSAERVDRTTIACVTAALDSGAVVVERDGVTARQPARFGVVALDEGLDSDETTAAALLDRLAFLLDLTSLSYRDTGETVGYACAAAVSEARDRLGEVEVGEDIVEALCGAAFALGIDSLRPSMMAVRAARAIAALAGRTEVGEEDAAAAARLVLAPRATRFPEADAGEDSETESPQPEPAPDDERSEGTPDGPLADQVLEAARAALPPALLDALLAGGAAIRTGSSGKAGEMRVSRLRGRPAGVRAGQPRDGARLNVIETLRSAAPWQRLRGRAVGDRSARVEVRSQDFRVTRFRERTETTSIFVVDASGSAAMHRLAEAKGAVELLLADCYVRRDRVALIAFRGAGAELLLPPTRSLVRARRNLARLPGGGGTPLAAAIDSSIAIAEAARRRGETPLVVFLTDGRANVGRDGIGGRTQARDDALRAARALRIAGCSALVIDTAPRTRPEAEELADAMGARFLRLPRADAAALSAAVRTQAPRTGGDTHAAA